MQDYNGKPGRPSKDNLIPIPEWFSLNNYSGLANFNSPRLWLEQLAYRIDMQARWQDVLAHDGPCDAQDEYFICNDIYVCDFYHLLQNSPILPFEELIEQCRTEGVELPACETVVSGIDPVRPMTWLDPVTNYAIGNRDNKLHADRFIESTIRAVPFPAEELALAIECDDANSRSGYPHESEMTYAQEVEAAFSRRLIEQIKLRRIMDEACGDDSPGAYHAFLDEPLSGKDPHEHIAFFSVDTRSTECAATRAFQKHFKLYQEAERVRRARTQSKSRKQENDMVIDLGLFEKWRNIALLPYVDLMILERMEEARQDNLSLRIDPEQIERTLYNRKGSDNQVVHSSIKSQLRRAKRLERALMDTKSKEYRCLLYESSESQFGDGRRRRKEQ